MKIENMNVKDREHAVMVANCMEEAGAEVFSIMESHSEGQWIVWCKVPSETVSNRYCDCFHKKLMARQKEQREKARKEAARNAARKAARERRNTAD